MQTLKHNGRRVWAVKRYPVKPSGQQSCYPEHSGLENHHGGEQGMARYLPSRHKVLGFYELRGTSLVIY